MKYLSKSNSLKYLCCPYDFKQSLKSSKDYLTCPKCNRKYKINNKIIEFVTIKSLDAKTKRELKGNTFKLDKKTIASYAEKDKWSSYHVSCSNKKFKLIIDKLNSLKINGLVSLGSGTGFEIKKILAVKKLKTVFSSDLSYTATMIVPHTLKDFKTEVCLFTSDMNLPPVVPSNKTPILIYEAMHHTGDIHYTMEQLLKRGYKDIIFLEPTTNFIIKILARYGLAERVEYSGDKPSLLDLSKLQKLAKKYGYNLESKTLWEFPEDFFRKLFGNFYPAEVVFLKFIDFVSWSTNFFKIGSMSFGHLQKR